MSIDKTNQGLKASNGGKKLWALYFSFKDVGYIVITRKDRISLLDSNHCNRNRYSTRIRVLESQCPARCLAYESNLNSLRATWYLSGTSQRFGKCTGFHMSCTICLLLSLSFISHPPEYRREKIEKLYALAVLLTLCSTHGYNESCQSLWSRRKCGLAFTNIIQYNTSPSRYVLLCDVV